MKFTSIAIALVMAASSANAANFKAPAPAAGMESSGMTISDKLDDSCLSKLAAASDLRGAVVDFAVSRDAIDTVALWPLVCAPTVESKSIDVERSGADMTLTYINKDATMPKLVLVLQRVKSENDDDAPAYQVVQVGDMNAMGYEEQAAVKDWLLDCYAATVQDDLTVVLN
ncbi:hypothetical protein pEaSNUABM40_00297 [Erwinia phage pEa_SNUABM_40]|nr:hypothetical protein pEaSNUABM20_00293 [Erwinia phage pEa_SNUABM_20]QZE58513.1 hypothetical protein pEaSNUABM40_00297 [Erwinia phage pEa_SNUABM_40]UAW53074.1 hypothetical protein pEaSNUABM23_00292 [Erwinia phage pEa_SNUABM_23]UIW10969.1 hypothetical protein pEaSNUABM23_00292 [Erwinia phage pEa_SNUABM_31]